MAMEIEKKITKELVLEVLGKINEKDFLRIIESVENAQKEATKARKNYNEFNPATGTYLAFKETESRVKVCSAIETTKLREFFDLFTARVRTFNGMSVIRKDKNEIKKDMV